MKIKIRQEIEMDKSVVYEVVKTAFDTAEFSDHDEQNLVNRLRKSTAFVEQLSLVAEIENRVVGYILFTEIEIGNSILLALAPVAVLPDMQGKGIGEKLICEGHKIAANMGYKGCVVMGHDKYYPRFGYEKASRYNIVAPFEVPDECFMVIEFEKDGLKGVSGVVKYAKEFFE